jgi:hypothetical protein
MARYTVLAAAAAALMTAGCAASATAPAVSGAGFSATPGIASLVRQPVAPEACGRVLHVKLHDPGGSFPVARCGGWSGTIGYPHLASSHVPLNVTSSLKNTFGAPPPPSGTAIFYMSLQLHRTPRGNGVNFEPGNVTSTVTSPAITPAHTYTLIAYNFAWNDQCKPGSCPPWKLNIGSPQPGSNSLAFSSPLNAAEFYSNYPVIFQFIQN